MSEQVVTTRMHSLFFWVMRIVAVLALAMAVVFLFLWILQPGSDTWKASLLFGFFGVVPWFVAVTYVEMSNQYILVNTFYGRFRINWDEVKYVETNGSGSLYAFCGENKRVVIVASTKLNNLMWQQIQDRSIEVQEAGLMPITHKNTRVKG